MHEIWDPIWFGVGVRYIEFGGDEQHLFLTIQEWCLEVLWFGFVTHQHDFFRSWRKHWNRDVLSLPCHKGNFSSTCGPRLLGPQTFFVE